MGDEKARARPVSQCQVMKWENGRRETYVQDASKRIWQADKLWQFESIFFILKELKIGKEKDWLGNNRQEEPTIQLRESSKRVIRQLDFKRARIRETGSKYSLLPWPKKQKKKRRFVVCEGDVTVGRQRLVCLHMSAYIRHDWVW